MSKFTVNRNALFNALSTTGKAINQNAIVPAFENYLFQITATKLTICACNGETFISQHLPIESDVEVNLQLPSRKMFDWINTLGDQVLTFNIGTNTIEIKASNDKCSVPFDDGNDYPLPQVDEAEEFTVDGNYLMDGIAKTVFAASTIEDKESYANVCIEVGGSEISFTATNKVLFSTWSYPIGIDTVKEVLVSPSSLNIVAASMYGAPVSVSIGKMITFKLITGVVIKCNLVNLKFIDYKKMVEKVYSNVIGYGRADLIASLKRSVIFSNDVAKLVNLYITPNETTIEGKDDDLARSSVSVLPTGGEAIDICVNGNLFISCLSKLGGDEVFVELLAHNRPVYIKSANAPKEKKNFMLLFPFVNL